MTSPPRPELIVWGPFPPPVHGLAVVTEALANRLASHARVTRFNVSARPISRFAAINISYRAVRLLVLMGRFGLHVFKSRPRVVFVELSAGYVQLADALCALLARMAGARVMIHHHSFAYLGHATTQWFNIAAFRILRGCEHIALCPQMQRLLRDHHGVERSQTLILSNAVFVPPVERSFGQPGGGALRLGFFSNITAEKGIFVLLELLLALEEDGLPVEGVIAGPVDPAIAAAFAARLRKVKSARHVGVVSKASKAAFLAGIDVLVFPSRHIHEAEPLVMIEALSYGVPVLATSRGCIPSAWGGQTGVSVLNDEIFAEQAGRRVRSLIQDPRALAAARESALVLYKDMHRHACAQLQRLLDSIVV